MISVVIPFGGSDPERAQNLAACLWHLHRQTLAPQEILLVEQSLDGAFHQRGAAGCRHIGIRDPLDRGFNLSWCRNVGVRQAAGTKVVICDSDLVIGDREFLAEIAQFTGEFGSGASEYLYATREQTEAYRATRSLESFRDGGLTYVPFTRNERGTELANGGVIVFDRDWFLNVFGGYHENFFRYGWEDAEAAVRIRHLTGRTAEELPRTRFRWIHLFHAQQDRTNQKLNQALAGRFAAMERELLCERMRRAGLGNPAAPSLVESPLSSVSANVAPR